MFADHSPRSSETGGAPPKRFLTPEGIATAGTWLTMTLASTLIVGVLDVIAYEVFHSMPAKDGSANSEKNALAAFIDIPALGGFIVAGLLWAGSFRYGLLEGLEDSQSKKSKLVLLGIITCIFSFNTAVGAFLDQVFFPDKHRDDTLECIIEKSVVLGFLIVCVAIALCCGAGKSLGQQIVQLFEGFKTKAERYIGPATKYEEVGCGLSCFSEVWATCFSSNKKAYASINADDNNVSRQSLVSAENNASDSCCC